jgi:hypothetical protein
MAQVEVVGDRLVIQLDRADRLWSFRSELQVPLAHVRGVEVDPERARVPWSGLPVRGENGWLPGMIAAGQVRQEGQWAFWDVHDPERAVIIDLADERYARLVIEVDDPWASAASINQALAVGPGRTTEAPAEPAPNVARAPGSRPPL